MSTLSNVTSTTNGKASRSTKAAKAALNGSTAAPKAKALTAAEAVEVAFEYGKSMAGQDGTVTAAFKQFAKNEKVIDDMVQALREGYYVRKMDYTRDEAKEVIALSKYNDDNPEKNSDKNRTKAQQNVMVAVNMLVSRAKRMAGITKPAATAEQEASRAKKEADAKEHESRLIKADAIVNPADTVDVFDALNQLVLTMKAVQKKHTAKLVGDRGSEWRDWLANAPR